MSEEGTAQDVGRDTPEDLRPQASENLMLGGACSAPGMFGVISRDSLFISCVSRPGRLRIHL